MDFRRTINRCGDKWAHPEFVEDNVAKVENIMSLYEGVEDNMDACALARKQEEADRAIWDGTLAYAQSPFAIWHGEGNWEEHYTEHGCPTEPDAPAVKILVRKPKNIKKREKLPVVFVLPSGGLTASGSAGCAAIAGGAPMMMPGNLRAIMVTCTYRLAPASRYPAAINDLHAVYLWMLEHAEDLHIDTDRIVFTGTSSGGGLCFSLAFRLKKYHWCEAPMPRGLIPVEPVLDDVAFTNSFRYSFYNEETDMIENWDSAAVERNMKLWLGERYGDVTLEPEAIPSRATLADIEGGFPPVWFACGSEMEPSRDTILSLAALLYEAGVFCDLHIWGGGTHLSSGASTTDLADRITRVKAGAVRDALMYDFRREWIYQ